MPRTRGRPRPVAVQGREHTRRAISADSSTLTLEPPPKLNAAADFSDFGLEMYVIDTSLNNLWRVSLVRRWRICDQSTRDAEKFRLRRAREYCELVVEQSRLTNHTGIS